jgi:hypothetical protein
MYVEVRSAWRRPSVVLRVRPLPAPPSLRYTARTQALQVEVEALKQALVEQVREYRLPVCLTGAGAVLWRLQTEHARWCATCGTSPSLCRARSVFVAQCRVWGRS